MNYGEKKKSHSHDFMFLWTFKCFASELDTDPGVFLSSVLMCNAISLIASTYACGSKTDFLSDFSEKVIVLRDVSTRVRLVETSCHFT